MVQQGAGAGRLREGFERVLDEVRKSLGAMEKNLCFGELLILGAMLDDVWAFLIFTWRSLGLS